VKRELYLKGISDELMSRYKLTNKEIQNLFEEYSFYELIDENEDYFFYQSPEYWVDYLVSPL